MPQTILIVEDNEAARTGLQAVLQAHHFQTTLATNADEALKSCRNASPPAVILLDMILPGSDGWKFIRERSRDRELAAIPFLIMTGLSIASEEWAKSLGAAALLRKPFEVDLLLDRLRKLTGSEHPSRS